ncbi:MAG: serine/threonine protein kinase [Myxococcaceae bacterium]|nr:serine/threonine protein kinase [Myxococcaceae bacterium]
MSLETYGRYQLIKKLATGGMAQIYLARQLGVQGFEKLLVVKRILPHLAENEDFITMFLDEARIAARLNHPNVVQIFDLGQQDDTFYIAMEYIHGEDVRKIWKQAERQGTPIPLPLICRIVIEACAGLDYAHKKTDPGGRPLNIVHRDISPQNILVSFEGGVKVVDFGIAKAADQATVTKSGVLKGKYSYMSPEQAQGRPVDARTDVFALGVVLYELLTGARLFKRANDIQTLNAVTECKIEPPSRVDDRVPADLDPIVMKALARERDDRYVNAREMQQALEDWVLKNKLPSGSVHLAAFMQDIYAERLAREAEEGRLLFTDSVAEISASDIEKATPNRPTKSIRTPTVSKQQAASKVTGARKEATRAEGGRSGPHAQPPELALGADVKPPPTENSLPTQQSAVSRGPLIALAAVVGLAVVLGAFVALRPAKTTVTIATSSPGASAVIDGRAPCRTPCQLTDLEPGPHDAELSAPGFEPTRFPFTVVASKANHFDVAMTAKQGAPPEKLEPVVVRLTSQPAGAVVTLEGVKKGQTPLDLQLTPGVGADLILELEGYERVTERLDVPKDRRELTRAFELKAVAAADPVVVAKKDPIKKDPVLPVKKDPVVVVKPPDVRPSGTGTVRFIANPFAIVECPPLRSFGETPFGDKQLPAGDYKCIFTNPELGKREVRAVHVEPGEVQKVKVDF